MALVENSTPAAAIAIRRVVRRVLGSSSDAGILGLLVEVLPWDESLDAGLLDSGSLDLGLIRGLLSNLP
jgi:hypothetical protein